MKKSATNFTNYTKGGWRFRGAFASRYITNRITGSVIKKIRGIRGKSFCRQFLPRGSSETESIEGNATGLPIELHRHLNFSRIVALTRDLAEVAASDASVRPAETGMVERVEKLRPVLEEHPFTKPIQRNFLEK